MIDFYLQMGTKLIVGTAAIFGFLSAASPGFPRLIRKTLNVWRKRNPKPFLVAIAILTFAMIATVALFIFNEKAKYQEVRSAEEAKRPEIHARGFRCYTLPFNLEGTTGIVVCIYLRLHNEGKPTGVSDWQMTVPAAKFQATNSYHAFEDIVPNWRVEFPVENGRTNTHMITAENYLPLQLYERGVGPERGGAGWVMFPILGIPPALEFMQLSATGVNLTIGFTQGDGRKQTFNHYFLDDHSR